MPSLVDSMRLKADQATLEADKVIRIRREQGVIDQLRRDIKTQLDALGQVALAAYRANEITHPQLLGICRQIDILNEQIGQREARIEQIRAEKLAAPSATPSTPQASLPCPNCRQLIPAGAAFCPACGYKVPKAPPAEIVCTGCGSAVPAVALFCPTCGTRRVQAPTTIHCTQCGLELPATAIFCPDCGTRVGQAAPPPAPPPIVAPPAVTAPATVVTPAAAEEVGEIEVRPELEPEAALPFDESATAAPTATTTALPALDPDEDTAPVAPAAAPRPITRLCPSCRIELPIEAIFCPDCGVHQPVF